MTVFFRISDRLRYTDETLCELATSLHTTATGTNTQNVRESASDRSSSNVASTGLFPAGNSLVETTPISTVQLSTPSAPVADRHAQSVCESSPYAETLPELAASSPSELAVDLASAILSQLTTASTAAVTSNATISNSIGKGSFL